MSSNQEIFDKVVKHLRKQGCKAIEFSLCKYRTDDGRKCAFGVLIPNKLYKKEFEGKLIWGVFNLSPGLRKMYEPHYNLILELQRMHDMDQVMDWERNFEKIARGYDLKYTKPRRSK